MKALLKNEYTRTPSRILFRECHRAGKLFVGIFLKISEHLTPDISFMINKTTIQNTKQ
ncbi:Uncharacterized protein dnm_056070 [Desulfonema magnum]|uniref:Uncharacterized protein n=1 Tax=Desulfonema magnum TaxID=45655 RepID=A0A975BPZ2_9BACT|nr:Uncharacterized protein dnm_056070 [Desulfonema magnum]